jgi:hypothetical protein
MLMILSETLPYNLTISVRPPSQEAFAPKELNVPNADIGILLQGPYIVPREFSLETALMYRKRFPNTPIVISTWNTKFPAYDRKKLEKNRITVVLLDEMSSRTPANEDLQSISTTKGLLHLKNLGVKWALKTRCDMRIYDAAVLHKLMVVLKAFPMEAEYSNQKYRIIGIDRNTRKFIPYSLSDVFLFGFVDDLLHYFLTLEEAELKVVNEKFRFPRKDLSIGEFARIESGEHFFCARFLRNSGECIDWNLQSWWNVLGRRFAIINAAELDIYWIKSRLRENWFNLYPRNYSEFILSQLDWLGFYFKDSEITKAESDSILSTPLKKGINQLW